MNYGIFRSQPIMTINDLAQIGSHNKREKKAYKSNPNIKLELTKNNVELVLLADKYVKGFKLLVKDYYRNLYEDKVKGVITDDMFKMMSTDYLKEIETMTKRIQIIDSEIDILQIVKEERKQADDILKKYKHIKELNKVIMDEFIDKVYIGEYDKENKTRDIEIEWNFEF